MCPVMRWSKKLARTAFYRSFNDCLLKDRELPQSVEFLPYARVKDQLNIDWDCIRKANRIIVPIKLKDKVLQMNLVRYYVWWPKIDEDIETLVKSCEPCQLNRNEPDKHSSHSWQYPAGPWQRIHIDNCGPFRVHNVSYSSRCIQ